MNHAVARLVKLTRGMPKRNVLAGGVNFMPPTSPLKKAKQPFSVKHNVVLFFCFDQFFRPKQAIRFRLPAQRRKVEFLRLAGI